jgi:choline dehydrogenase-like flavoprotein
LTDAAVQDTEWDVIVVGGGMGGGAAAWALSRAGHRTLLVEKGLSQYEEVYSDQASDPPEDPEERLRFGRWPTKVTTVVDGRETQRWPSLGCGLGGTSTIYAATLERLAPEDFEPRDTPAGETVGWPFGYRDIEPYYQQAEALFGVRGTPDPLDTVSTCTLRPPADMPSVDVRLYDTLAQAKLHPYRLHVAYEYLPDCTECGGYYCVRQCKKDARNVCVLPARDRHGLRVLDRAEVQRVQFEDSRATGLQVLRDGAVLQLRARVVVLAAGAYGTACLLLRSTGAQAPRGLGNGSDLVGRNLMFHATDFIAIWPRPASRGAGARRSIGLRDLYGHGGMRLGQLQSTGLTAGYGNVLYALYRLFDASALRRLRLLRPLLRIPAKIASWVLKDATVFANNIEDHPYPENRVVLDDASPSGFRMEYRIHAELRERVFAFRRLLRKAAPKLRILPLHGGVELNYGHVCGTCRAGHDPATSVVDAACRVHGTDNLYVTDASIFPTSGGINPSLTIVANALRVAQIIDRQLRS